jgi:hypothetical protein
MKDSHGSTGILGRPFNLAGIVRGILLGFSCGVLGLAVVGLFDVVIFGSDGISNPTLYGVSIATLIVVVVLGYRGARSEPKEITEGTRKWVRSTWVSGRKDIIIPESITLRSLFKTILLYALVLVVIVGLVILVMWWQGSL